ncbi:MAG TPA: hypothetical protein PKN32_14735 [Bacteroidales bacterium]|nr:hypothetical protein [Bacteroidales bacterium]
MSTINCQYSNPRNFENSTPSTSLEVWQYQDVTCDYPDLPNSATASGSILIDNDQFSIISDYQSLGLYTYAILLFFVGYFVVKSMFDR